LRWGLVPSWAKDLKFGARCVNARVETAATKPAFRAAWKSRRCLVPASGFYEWTATRPKEAWFFRAAGGTPLFFAGLWETWTDQATGEVVEHAAVGHVVGDAEAARTIGTS
jgi:putative SOS response-associated peptidase YedK